MSDEIKFIDYDIQAQERELVEYAEEILEKPLYPAQYERLMISIIEYKASLLVEMFNEAAKKNLARYSSGLILEAIGEAVNVKRLQGEAGVDLLKITLNTTFTNDLTISKGLEVMSKDEKYTFETTEDLIIPAGKDVGYVKIKAQKLGEAVNIYGVGDVNILVRPISYIKSVTNVNGVSAGADAESDEALISRIILAPEGYSCAGSKNSYIYHTLSANTNIVDAQAESPQIPASITLNEVTTQEENGEISCEDYSATVDYKTNTCTLTIGEDVYKITIPSQSTVNIYPLTLSDETPQAVLEDVEEKLNGEEINPMCDYVRVIAPTKKALTINLNVVTNFDANVEEIEEKVNDIVNTYILKIRKKLKASIIPSQIIALVGSIDGVYSCDCGNLTQTCAAANEFYDLTFNTVIKQGAI